MAQALLLRFSGLLRVGEIINCKLGHFAFLKEDYAVLTLPESKGASRSGKPESVAFRDPSLIRLVKTRWEREGGEAPLLETNYASFSSEYKSLAGF